MLINLPNCQDMIHILSDLFYFEMIIRNNHNCITDIEDPNQTVLVQSDQDIRCPLIEPLINEYCRI